jgi:hypothetical protein
VRNLALDISMRIQRLKKNAAEARAAEGLDVYADSVESEVADTVNDLDQKQAAKRIRSLNKKEYQEK